jgi:phage FluMu protein gp41
MFQTEFDFTLPKGYLDGEGNLHRKGVMKLSKAIDEIVPLKDPRVRANPAYATVIILARVITQLGALEEVSPNVIEGLFASDLNYLHQFYRQINDLEEPDQPALEIPDFAPLLSHPEAQSQNIYETS